MPDPKLRKDAAAPVDWFGKHFAKFALVARSCLGPSCQYVLRVACSTFTSDVDSSTMCVSNNIHMMSGGRRVFVRTSSCSSLDIVVRGGLGCALDVNITMF